MCHTTGGTCVTQHKTHVSHSNVSFFFSGGMLGVVFFISVGESGGKSKTTPDTGGKSVSEKSQVTITSKNSLRNQTVTRNNISFWRSCSQGQTDREDWSWVPHQVVLLSDDTWEPITNFKGSEHMIPYKSTNYQPTVDKHRLWIRSYW